MQPVRSAIIQWSRAAGSPSQNAVPVMLVRVSSARASASVAQRPSSHGISSNWATFSAPSRTGWYTALSTKFSPAMHRPFSFTAS